MLRFAPAIDDRITPGVLSECNNLRPTIAGYKPYQVTPIVGESVTLGAESSKAAYVGLTTAKTVYRYNKITPSDYIFLQDGIFESGYGMVNTGLAGSGAPPSCCAFQSRVYCTSSTFGFREQAGSGDPFNVVAGVDFTPRIIIALGPQIVAMNCDDGGASPPFYTSQTVRACAIGNPNEWVPDGANNAFAYDIVDDEGPILAGAEYRNNAVVFKRSAIYLMTPTGDASTVFSVQSITRQYGCEHQNAIVEHGNYLYFLSPTNGGEFCRFDGASVQSVSTDLGPLSKYEVSQGGNDYVFGSVWSAATDGRYIYLLNVEGYTDDGITKPANLAAHVQLIYDTLTKRWSGAIRSKQVDGVDTVPICAITNSDTGFSPAYVSLDTESDTVGYFGVMKETGYAKSVPTWSFALERRHPNGRMINVSTVQIAKKDLAELNAEMAPTLTGELRDLAGVSAQTMTWNAESGSLSCAPLTTRKVKISIEGQGITELYATLISGADAGDPVSRNHRFIE